MTPHLALGGGAIVAIVIGVVLLLLILWIIAAYNKLIVGRNRVKNAFAQIDVQLNRRYDLIPNLIETAKGYMKHERETLEAVTEARNQAAAAAKAVGGDPTNAGAMQALSGAEGSLLGALGKLNVSMEAYPDLKANQNFLALQSQLEGTENRIAVARRDYITAVQQYNTEIRTFPGRIWHSMLYSEMEVRPSFEATTEGAEQAPQVNFN